MEWLKKNFGLLVTIAGWIFSLGLCYGKVTQQEIEIQELKTKSSSLECSFNEMSKMLTTINTKMDLLLDNKLVVSVNPQTKQHEN